MVRSSARSSVRRSAGLPDGARLVAGVFAAMSPGAGNQFGSFGHKEWTDGSTLTLREASRLTCRGFTPPRATRVPASCGGTNRMVPGGCVHRAAPAQSGTTHRARQPSDFHLIDALLLPVLSPLKPANLPANDWTVAQASVLLGHGYRNDDRAPTGEIAATRSIAWLPEPKNTATTVEVLKTLVNAATRTATPVLIQIDLEHWWDARPDLWNWWDPSRAGVRGTQKWVPLATGGCMLVQ